MPDGTRPTRILVKARPGLSSATLALEAGPVGFEIEPLFRSIGGGPALGAAPTSVWHAMTAAAGADPVNPWDLCHALLADGFGVAGVPAPEFAEPDAAQRWIAGDLGRQGLALAASCTAAAPQDDDFPRNPDPFWFHDPGYSQFAAALETIGGPGVSPRVRIAHLDTGYDPSHKTLPLRLRPDLGRNFVDDDRPDDASDRSEGLLNTLGHGAGTLGILAGSAPDGGVAVGGAPFAEVVPLRVADRVVLFYNGAIARAFDYVHLLCRNPATRVDVVTMSMGGLASQSWAEAVNALYDIGVFVVTAAGNNFGNLPTRNIVYPARFGRVVAACGVMADHTPYADLGLRRMAGNYGPDRKMATAISACTPNIPWAKLGCPEIVDLDGAGTSAATPQVAAAAAIWIHRNADALDAYPERWMRVEAVRKALFERAHAIAAERHRLGVGELRAAAALAEAPAPAAALSAREPDSASFSILRVLTGLGIAAAPDARQRMLELEALQLSQSAAIEVILPDPAAPPESLSPAELVRLADALMAQPGASSALRAALGGQVRREVRSVAAVSSPSGGIERLHLDHATDPPPPRPAHRRLRVFAYDPVLGTDLETLGINEAVLDVKWEDGLAPGPVGEYVEVIDVDPPSQCCYAPVDLNHPHLLTSDGLAPSEANPQFHQQMAYAVAMKTVEHFERALGRVALWAPRFVPGPAGARRERFVRRLRVYPHALRAANAYYSPDRVALLMGYFSASANDSGDVLPGGLVFTALSHDIIAHETTHALLDGLHRRFREPTNPDMLAFHEAFADIVALFQHFTMPEALRQQIAKTRGDLGQQNLLASLAIEFGQATGLGYRGLRNAIAAPPTRADYKNATEPHARGAVLVSAVFDAFLQIYRARTQDLVRLATGGTGVLPPGDIPIDLVDRLAREASKVAGHVLNICIRALDYCPPVDLTFGEYLRALVTADRDLVPDDKRAYRVAFISAFRARGIYPADVKHLSVGSLVWEPPPLQFEKIAGVLRRMSVAWNLGAERKAAYDASRDNARKMHDWLIGETSDDELAALGLVRSQQPMEIGGVAGEIGPLEVHSVRPARRVGPDGQMRSDLVVEITQTFRSESLADGRYRGGCTLLIDLEGGEVRYLVRKRVQSPERLAAQQSFALTIADHLRAAYFSAPRPGAEPFALLHRPH